jgi:hypothetical protein
MIFRRKNTKLFRCETLEGRNMDGLGKKRQKTVEETASLGTTYRGKK